MAKKPFTITLFPENVAQIQQALQFMLPEKHQELFFFMEGRPNIEVGDTFNVRMYVDAGSIIKFEGIVDDICPPLLQPPSDKVFEPHMEVLHKYLKMSMIDQISYDYFKGKVRKSLWTVYFRKVENDVNESANNTENTQQ